MTLTFSKIRFILPLIVLLILWAQYMMGQSPFVYKTPKYKSEWNQPTVHPDRVILNPTADPATSMSVTWRTSVDIQSGVAEIAIATAAPKFWRNAVSITANTETLDVHHVLRAEVIANYHSATFSDLLPNTLYAYRVGNSDYWSEWFQFRTADDKPGRFSFLYFGDVQNNILDLWSRVVREGYRKKPDAAFIIYAGDLINRAHNDTEWHEWFSAGGWIHSTIPTIPAVGNHEYDAIDRVSERQLSVQWRPQFTLPLNGCQGLEETVYYVDYQNLRLIVLNTMEDKASQAAWLEEVLVNNTRRWTIVTYHHPLFNAAEGRSDDGWRDVLKPLFDKYGVDLALQGHDHTYARGRSGIISENTSSGINTRDHTGTVYVVSISGAKMYNSKKNAWNEYPDVTRDRHAENTQLYQVISIDGDILKYESFTPTGELYDAFELIKNNNQANTFIELQHEAMPTRTHLNTIRYYDTLPDDLKDMILSKYDGYTISRVRIIERKNQGVYELRLKREQEEILIIIDHNGQLLSIDE